MKFEVTSDKRVLIVTDDNGNKQPFIVELLPTMLEASKKEKQKGEDFVKRMDKQISDIELFIAEANKS